VVRSAWRPALWVVLFVGMNLCSVIIVRSVLGAEELPVISTSQLWGDALKDGKPWATTGIAGIFSVRQLGFKTLACHFVQILETVETHACYIDTWTETLRLVSRTPQRIVWNATQGPTPAAGLVITSTLTVEPGSFREKGDKAFLTVGPMAATDDWSYTSVRTIANPPPSGIGAGVVQKNVKGGPKNPMRPALSCPTPYLAPSLPTAGDE